MGKPGLLPLLPSGLPIPSGPERSGQNRRSDARSHSVSAHPVFLFLRSRSERLTVGVASTPFISRVSAHPVFLFLRSRSERLTVGVASTPFISRVSAQ